MFSVNVEVKVWHLNLSANWNSRFRHIADFPATENRFSDNCSLSGCYTLTSGHLQSPIIKIHHFKPIGECTYTT